MSQTLELCCLDCKEHLWIGQRPSPAKPEQAYVYFTEEAQAHLNRFVRRHVGHQLKIVDPKEFDTLDAYDWPDVEEMIDENPQPHGGSDGY